MIISIITVDQNLYQYITKIEKKTNLDYKILLKDLENDKKDYEEDLKNLEEEKLDINLEKNILLKKKFNIQ